MVKVEWTEQAFADLQKLDPPIRKRLLAKIGWISGHFSKITTEPLSGEFERAFKIRAGDWTREGMASHAPTGSSTPWKKT